MNKVIKIMMIVCLSLPMLSLQAQEERGERFKKLESLKIAHITTELNLTEAESMDFWPVYNKYETAKRELKKGMREEHKRSEEMNDAEAEQALKDHFNMRERMLDIDKQQAAALSKIIGYKRLIKMHEAERDFRMKILKEHKRGRNHGDMPHERPPMDRN